MTYSVATHSLRLGGASHWLYGEPTFGDLLVSYRSKAELRLFAGVRRSARIWLDEIELKPNFEQLTAPSLFNEGRVHKVEVMGDDAYTIFRKGKGKKVLYALSRNGALLIDWKPSPRDAEDRIKIERMRFVKGKAALRKAEDLETQRLKQIPEWGQF